MEEEEEENDLLLTDHELCGFILAVVTASSPVLPGTPCSLSASTVGFLTKSGTFLLPISEKSDTITTCVPKQRRKRRNTVGIGSGSVVHQIHALAANRCLSVRGRVVKVSIGVEGEENGRVRAVVMVDVYLPVAIRSGWQFPKSGALAAALFKHVSCNWETRRSLLASYKYEGQSPYEDDGCLWNNSDCHVFQCNLHHSESESSKKKLFDIHEMFKTLPSAVKEQTVCSTSIKLEDVTDRSGIWSVSEDVLTTILGFLSLRDLSSVSLTCRHLMSLALSITPCAKLKLFPHQQAAVDWMLKRECNVTVLPHPLYMNFCTEDRFDYYLNSISGKISTGMVPTINDFHGGMFCDEPGLGKTITALSLILKTHGKLADPPPGVDAMWCVHNQEQRCAYYDLNSDNSANINSRSTWKRVQSVRRGSTILPGMSSRLELSGNSKTPPLKRTFDLAYDQMHPFDKLGGLSYGVSDSLPETHVLQGNRKPSNVRRSLLDAFGRSSACPRKTRKKSNDTKQINSSLDEDLSFVISHKKQEKSNGSITDLDETWVQCDACRKWRRLSERDTPDATAAWFCSMNSDQLFQSCAAREESWDQKQMITNLPGFYTKGTSPGKDQNVSYFVTVLKEHFSLLNSVTIKALNWLSDLSYDKLTLLERNGLTLPVVGICGNSSRQTHGYEKIFQAFGLDRKLIRGRVSWNYPLNLKNLMFDTLALQTALTKPLDSFRLYLSRATLIIVPVNLVEHWKTQIEKHVVPGQLRVLIWTDHRKPSVHSLAWDYDIVVTTFSRLSAEWSPRKRSILMQVHWLRVMLDEGHTLGSSLSLTNKLQMAISLTACNRWILTGTPTPNTPSSQLAHLQPMLKFLHEEAYGLDQRSWDVGILKPFEAEMEEGRSRLLQLLKRAMISARKKDLENVPPCIKKVTLLDFNEKHARSYNELVVTVRRNILMADWNDPSHVESLLNPRQWKFRSNTIRNIRLSCCVSGHIKVAEVGTDIQDTMDVLVQQGLDPLSESYELTRVALLCGGNCFRCNVWCRLPVITPCRHLLCLDCVALDSERCTLPGCGKTYEMQFPEALTRPENPNPKWPVPKDLIELQPSYRQDNWDPDWQSTSSSKVAYLVQRLKTLREANRKFGYCENVNDCPRFSPHSNCHCGFLTEGVCRKKHDLSSMLKHDKVIIFSQFLEHIHVIEQQLTIAGIDYVGMYSPMHSSNKMKSLMVFQQDPSCMALLMDGSAALGLDLSFVTHVFLMEPIWDRSMEEQVISRAHRMGATRAINVETLAMRGTIEEQMLQFLEDSTECRKAMKQDVRGTEFEGTRVHRTLHDFAANTYLTRLGFVRTDNTKAKAKAKKNQPMKQSMGENSCQLCAVEKLAFEHPPMYCSICGARIKNNAIYYTYGNTDTRLYLCNPCHRGARGDTVKVDGLLLLKEKFHKKKNDEKTEEWWVQCDKCEAWQHQICALFNGRRNEGEQAEYTCPNCYALEVERGERKPLAPNSILGADDLPKTLLSDHLEQRLRRKLKQERHDRASFHGKSFDEVPGVESLVVRVVSSVDKKLDVKPRFLEIFHEDKYPKVVLLFQKIEGVEVCLFGMYVQEFGSECEFPNQRRVYLSYLDSVKYFRPEVKTVNGEALRTFVYHEILIGYLENCKKRGFTSCYIWACPPLKGEDYILYCHPEIQKTPKSDKLREWYLQMLRKAKKENIVVDLTNLYDHFFVTSGECKAKVTAARLPYFDGDYWPGAAEDMINMLQQEENARKQKEKGETKESITRRTLKAAGQTDLSGNASKDALLMQKLGETISPLKEDFIMVHLQHACSHCCLLMVSGNRWFCSQCGNFQLCDRCYITEQECEEKDRHPNTSMDKHQLYPVQITDVPSDTKDRDGIIESEFFDTRQAFLSLCQGNHYQYDTLRRAKHSSMMLLYHLHNPTAPAFVATCNACHHDIEAGQGWHCDVCADFDMCNICYTKDGGLDHPHKLTNQQSVFDAQNTEARKKRVLQLRKMLDLLVHASKCRAPESLHCKNPDCLKVKRVFHHAKLCEVRAGGGCQVCRKMWSLLRFHAQGCKELVCCVPRCRDLKENILRLQKQSDSRRRAAVKEMTRQRAAEI